MPEPPFPVGERLRRKEDPRLLRGEGQYVGDLRLPGMQFVAFVRCLRGHARILDVHADGARALPGVSAVFTAHDLSVLGTPMAAVFQQPDVDVRMPSPLANGVVRYAGEPVVAIVAANPYVAADAAALVEIDYQDLPAVLDLEDALEDTPGLVHADVPRNLAGHFSRGYGDVQRAFDEAAVVVRERLRVERSTGAAMEPRCVAAAPRHEPGYAITIWDSTQAPHIIRRCVAETLGLDESEVRVITPDVGGGFGPKGRFYPEEAVVAALSHHLGYPLLWQATRQEDLLATYQGRGVIADAELAADEAGRILGYRVHLIQDCGAYLPTAMVVPTNSAQHLLGPYHIPNFEARIDGVYTNRAPLTPLRGGGREVGVYVTERMLDHLARRLGLDPALVRERNVLQPDEFPYDTGYPSQRGGTVTYDSGDYPGCLQRALSLIGYHSVKAMQPGEREAGRYRGVAVTLFLESTGMDRESARAEVSPDGLVTLTVGSPSNGQSHATTMSQMCAGYLGVPFGAIEYISGDTAAMEQGTGTFGSRMMVMAGNAVAQASQSLREQLLRAAEDELEVSWHDLDLLEGQVEVRGAPGHGLALAELARKLHDSGRAGALTTSYTWAPERPTSFSGGAHAAIVEVDIETGKVHIERYVVVHDCGTVVNPMVVDGQVQGGVVHGLGNALFERSVYDASGASLTDTFQSYALALAEEMPPIEVHHHESPSPFNPEGIKGAGEGGTIGALATVARAVEDALEPLDLSINALPVTPPELATACTPLRERIRAS